MQPKKNQKADLSKNSSLYFVIGLSVILLISWQAIEWKTYDRSVYDYEALNVEDDDDEEIPITEQLKTPPPPPPPPPPAPEVIEVVEDEEEVEETVIESTETNEDEIVEVEEVEIEEVEEDIDVPFAVIEDVPIFPGCEKVSKDKRRDCFQEKMNNHIRKNFRYPEIAQEMGIQGRVYVNFIIDKDGSITNIRMRGPDQNLEKEAQRIISRLPSMTPGKQRGRPVRVPFSIPITFRLQ
ncbi:MAG: energy transducer TonB [Bacteroidetes bacterium]|nr:energy transducer TonB [Bacteroidota bacterium]MDA0922676.1 energy transducer TonB [Bacteroidota bacterium]MDA1288912.1 energy transducer TonB [Bacteroidota bacterium]